MYLVATVNREDSVYSLYKTARGYINTCTSDNPNKEDPQPIDMTGTDPQDLSDDTALLHFLGGLTQRILGISEEAKARWREGGGK